LRGGGSRLATMLIALAAFTAARPASAQWRVEAQAGRLSYETTPEASTSLSLALRRVTLDSDYGLATGIPLTDEDPLWGALYGSHRLTRGDPVAVGVDLAASGFGYRVESVDTLRLFPRLRTADSHTGWGASAEAMPLVTWDGGAWGAEARAGGAFFTTSGSDVDDLSRAAFAADAALHASPVLSLTTTAEARWLYVSEGGFPWVGARVVWAPSFAIWGSVGAWLDDALNGAAWSAGAAVPLGDRVSALLTGRHDPIDPLYLTPERTSWGVGVSVRLGEGAATAAEPVPAAYDDGIATVRLAAADVADAPPSIAGDFNGWTPAPMTSDGESWSYELPLQPGVYHYAFVDASGEWFVPEGTPGRRDDGMGGWVAVLVVEP